MKKALLFLILIFFYVLIYGQMTNDKEKIIHEKILTTDTLIKGIYMNFSEFQQNNPSIRADFKSNEENLRVNYIYDEMAVKRLRILNSNNAFVPFGQKHWGICDGKHVFKNYKGRYGQISIDGKYSSFTTIIYTNYARSSHYEDYLLNVVNGDIIKVELKSIRLILSKENISLYNEFKKDKNKKMMIYTYINWLNQSYEYE